MIQDRPKSLVSNNGKRYLDEAEERGKAIWTVLSVGYAAIILALIEELRIDRRLKNVVIRLSDFKRKRGLCCLRV